MRERSVYTAKLSGFKSFRIQRFHFRFWIQNLRRHDQTGMFSFRIRSLVCKRQNQSDTKTFRIHNEYGTISSSVNLVSLSILLVDDKLSSSVRLLIKFRPLIGVGKVSVKWIKKTSSTTSKGFRPK